MTVGNGAITMANEIVFEKSSAKMLSTLYDGEAKCRIECEEILPDYKEDVNRLISVSVKPKIIMKKQYLQGSYFMIELDGTAAFNVVYKSSEKSALTSHTFYEDFSHTFKLPLDEPGEYDAEGAAVFLTLGTEATSYRAVSGRKLSLKSTVNIGACVKCNRNILYYGDRCGEIEKKMQTVSATVIKAVADREFSFEESITLPREYLPCSEIIDCDADLACRNVKVTDGKVIFNADANICCGYQSAAEENNSRLISFSQPIEISEAIEIDSLSDGALCEVLLTPSSLKAECDIDSYGESRVIKLEIGYIATAVAYETTEISVLSDCYSTSSVISVVSKELKAEQLTGIFSATCDLRNAISSDLPANSSCECIRASLEFKKAEIIEKSISLEGTLSAHYIVVDSEGGASEKNDSVAITALVRPDVSLELSDDSSIRMEAYGDVCGCDIEPSANGADMRCDALIHVRIYRKAAVSSIDSISAEGAKPASAAKSLIFCYPSGKESLWDIAKHYSVPVEKLALDNGIDNDKPGNVIKVFPNGRTADK